MVLFCWYCFEELWNKVTNQKLSLDVRLFFFYLSYGKIMPFKILDPYQKFIEFQNCINFHHTNYSTLVRWLAIGINQYYFIKLWSKTSSHQNNCLNCEFYSQSGIDLRQNEVCLQRCPPHFKASHQLCYLIP